MSNGLEARVASTDWSSAGHHAHLVQFYNDEPTLIRLLSPFIGTALVRGDSALVVATRAHRVALKEQLHSRGFDTSFAVAEGRYLAMDADEVLKQIVGSNRPDAERFERAMTPIVERLLRAADGPVARLAAFGEMVALLWARGRSEHALHLEEIWTEFIDRHAVTLCCAYPMDVFKTSRDTAQFLRVCAQHTHVFPAPGPRPIRSQPGASA
jgi:hypothetical protein